MILLMEAKGDPAKVWGETHVHSHAGSIRSQGHRAGWCL